MDLGQRGQDRPKPRLVQNLVGSTEASPPRMGLQARLQRLPDLAAGPGWWRRHARRPQEAQAVLSRARLTGSLPLERVSMFQPLSLACCCLLPWAPGAGTHPSQRRQEGLSLGPKCSVSPGEVQLRSEARRTSGGFCLKRESRGTFREQGGCRTPGGHLSEAGAGHLHPCGLAVVSRGKAAVTAPEESRGQNGAGQTLGRGAPGRVHVLSPESWSSKREEGIRPWPYKGHA